MDNIIDIKNNKLNFNNKEVYIILDKDNEPWFKGKDICKILEYERSRDAISRHIDEEDKVKYKEFPEAVKHGVENIDVKTIFINESGLYSLILSSKLPQAKEFKRWVTKDVLPSIRKTGEYKLQKELKKKDKEIKLCKENLEKEKRRTLRLKELAIQYKLRDMDQIVYISTCKSYAKQNRFKIGGVECKEKLKGRLCNYNTSSAKGDEWYFCKIYKVSNYKTAENRILDLLDKFRDDQDKKRKEMLHIHFDDLKDILDFICEDYEEEIDYLNDNIKQYVDNLDIDIKKPIIPNKIFY